jgi:outer membrane lipoprotein-sorting protein
MSIRLPFALTAAALLFATLGMSPNTNAAGSPILDARAVLRHMSERNPTLQSYRARVHVDVRMLNFPFLAPKLDGTSYYKRPDLYVVVFDRMPSYARGFQKLFNDVGNPNQWQRDSNVEVTGTAMIDNREMIVLRMTKKIHSDILDHTLAYVDPTDYELARMEWYYTSGGKIAMTQEYRVQGMYSVLSRQHATIEIPHVRAVADASYGTYETNVPVETGAPEAR